MLLGAGLSLCAASADEPAAVPPARLANGTVIEGTVLEATAEGLVIQGTRNKYTAPWKYLSAGTRYRYQRSMLSAPEAAHTNAPKKTSGAAKPAAKPSGK